MPGVSLITLILPLSWLSSGTAPPSTNLSDNGELVRLRGIVLFLFQLPSGHFTELFKIANLSDVALMLFDQRVTNPWDSELGVCWDGVTLYTLHTYYI